MSDDKPYGYAVVKSEVFWGAMPLVLVVRSLIIFPLILMVHPLKLGVIIQIGVLENKGDINYKGIELHFF